MANQLRVNALPPPEEPEVESARAHYLDASVLVKIVADDEDEAPGRAVFRSYYFNHPSMYTTSLCVAECFSAFKLKFVRGKISRPEYVRYIQEFVRLGIGFKLRIDDLELLAPEVQSEAERLINKYEIDFIDAVQIVTLMIGQFRALVAGSQSILITADRLLAKAAKAEGARVWECTIEISPV
jgi:predicted nucleic acid-binding protein